MINLVEILDKHWQKIIFVALAIFASYFWWKTDRLQNQADEARIEAQNQIAELSAVVRETNGSFSRLAQQAENSNQIMRELQNSNAGLAEIIQQRDEQRVVRRGVVSPPPTRDGKTLLPKVS